MRTALFSQFASRALTTESKERREIARQNIGIEGFAFPYDQHFPTKRLQLTCFKRISFDVARKFFGPERSTCFRSRRSRTASMSMPETSMDEDDFSKP